MRIMKLITIVVHKKKIEKNNDVDKNDDINRNHENKKI